MHPLIVTMSPPVLRFNGTFSTTSGSSPVTSSTLAINLPGTLRFDDVSAASGTYSKNGASFEPITEDLTLVMAGADTLAIRLTSGIPTDLQINLRNNLTGALIEAITMTRA